MNAASHGVREVAPGVDAFVEDLAGFGIVVDAVDRGADERQVHLRVGVDVFGEPTQHTGHVLHVIPA